MSTIADALRSLVLSETGSPLVGCDSAHVRILTPREPAGGYSIKLAIDAFGIEAASVCHDLARWLEDSNVAERALAEAHRVDVSLSLQFMVKALAEADWNTTSILDVDADPRRRTVRVLCASPNANKPLHVGHLRQSFLGMSLSRLIEASGCTAQRLAMFSDWGIHICQAAVAYQRWGSGSSPASTGTKGDHFVGRLLTRFHDEDAAEQDTTGRVPPDGVLPLRGQAQSLLRRMEAGDVPSRALAEQITGWAMAGLRETYERIGARWDLVVFETAHREPGTALVIQGAVDGRLFRRPDTSVYADLTREGFGELTLLRSDGTPTVSAQLLGVRVALEALGEVDEIVSVNGRQWDQGFLANRALDRQMGYGWTERYQRVNYGMVTVPDGFMSSRRRTGVAADHILEGARLHLIARCDKEQAVSSSAVCEQLAVGLVAFYLLRVGRKHDLRYDETELFGTVLEEFATIVRATTVTTAESSGRLDRGSAVAPRSTDLRALVGRLDAFPAVAQRALTRRDPAYVARFLADVSFRAVELGTELTIEAELAWLVGRVLVRSLDYLGIRLPPVHEYLPPPFGSDE